MTPVLCDSRQVGSRRAPSSEWCTRLQDLGIATRNAWTRTAAILARRVRPNELTMSAGVAANRPRQSSARAATGIICIRMSFLFSLAPWASSAQDCQYGDWSVPQAVGQRVVARDPSVVRLDKRLYFVGSNTARFDSLPPADSLLTLVDVNGAPLPPPPGHHVFMLPRLAKLTESTLLMIWGEPDSIPADRRLPTWTPVAKLWAAAWSRRGWSEAHLLLSDAAIAWTAEAVTGPITSNDGDVLLAVPRRKGLQYLQYHEGEWRSVLIPLALSAVYASVSIDPASKDVLIAYIAAAPNSTRDANSVLLTRSHDGGASWSAPTLVSRSGNTPAFEVNLLRGPHGMLQLAWMQDQTGDMVPEVIRRVESTDGGHTWQSPSDLRLPPGSRALSATMDACGSLHVIYQDWKGGGTTGHLDYARFTTHGWSRIQHLLPRSTMVSGSISSLDAADILLVFLSRRDATNPREPLRLRYSQLPVSVWRPPD
jgi:hypothetical protein